MHTFGGTTLNKASAFDKSWYTTMGVVIASVEFCPGVPGHDWNTVAILMV